MPRPVKLSMRNVATPAWRSSSTHRVLARTNPSGAVNEHDGRAPFDLRRGKPEVAPDQPGGRGLDPVEDLGHRWRGGLETDAADRSSRERRVDRGRRTTVYVPHRRCARDFPPVGKNGAQCVANLTRRLPWRTPVQEAALELALVSLTAAKPQGSPRYEKVHRTVGAGRIQTSH
jgi:hypothetical protein